MNRRRVLFVVPALRRAGAESQLLKLVNGLPATEYEKHVVSYIPGDGLKSDLAEDVRIHEFLRRGKFDPGVGKKIAGIIDEFDIEVVHCTLLNALMFGLLGRFIAKRNPPVISVIHTTRNVDLKHKLAEMFVYRPMMKRADQIWFVSSLQAKLWIEKMPFVSKKCQTIHNGVDIEWFHPDQMQGAGVKLREQYGLATDEAAICCIAGLRPEKLHHVLLEAFDIVRRRGVRCKLLLAGEGPMEPRLRELVTELHREREVVFLGSLADVRPLLAASDCKVLASAAETFSMAMLESMAMGVPVISTEVGGASEAIEDHVSGTLVAAGDADQLADRITEVLGDSALRARMGASARETVVEKFRQELMIEKSAACLQQLLCCE